VAGVLTLEIHKIVKKNIRL